MINFIDFDIEEFGVEQCISEKIFTYTVKDYDLIHFVLSGEGTFEFENKKYELRKGSLFYIPAFNEANYYPKKDNPWQYVWVGFKGVNVKKLLDEARITINHPVYIGNNEKLIGLYKKLFEAHSLSEQNRNILLVSIVYEIFYELIKINKNYDRSGFSGVEGLIENAKNFINHNYQFNIKVQDVANDVSVSSEYLSRIFSKIEGISTVAYLKKVRMEVGKSLLLNTDYPINEISKKCGYNSPLYFTNDFKKYYGESPVSYRRAKGGKDEEE